MCRTCPCAQVRPLYVEGRDGTALDLSALLHTAVLVLHALHDTARQQQVTRGLIPGQ